MELSHYLTVLRRRLVLVVTGFVGGVVLAVGVLVVAPSSSTASTSVQLHVISSNAFANSRPDSDLVDPQTEQSMARSTTVMDTVAQELGGDWSRSRVRRSTEATLLPEGTVLRIEFTAPTARSAARGASLVAEQYLRYRSALAQTRVDLATEPLTVRADALRKRLAEENQTIARSATGSRERTSAELRAEEVRTELAAVSARTSELAAISTSGGQVLTEADPAQVGTSPNRTMVLLSGSLGGLLLGLVAAFVANVLDRRVRDAYDVAGAGGGDVLATFGGGAPELPAIGEDADEFRALRERLLAGVTAPAPVLAVLDVAPSGGAPSDVGVGLALALADAGVATDLVLAGHASEVVELVASALGMVEVETHGRGRRFRGGVAESLTVVVPGSSRLRQATSDLLAELLEEHVRAAEVTVVAGDPSAGASVRLTAGRAAHRTVLVVREAETSIDDLSQVAGDLQGVWAELHGTVLTGSGRRLAIPVQPEPAVEPAGEEAAEDADVAAPAGETTPETTPEETTPGTAPGPEREPVEPPAAVRDEPAGEAADEPEEESVGEPVDEPSGEVHPEPELAAVASVPAGVEDPDPESDPEGERASWAFER